RRTRRRRPRNPVDAARRGAVLRRDRLLAGDRSRHRPQALWPGPLPLAKGPLPTRPAGGVVMTDVAVQQEASLESLLAQVADQFLEQRKQGQNPDIEDYAARYPQAAE